MLPGSVPATHNHLTCGNNTQIQHAERLLNVCREQTALASRRVAGKPPKISRGTLPFEVVWVSVFLKMPSITTLYNKCAFVRLQVVKHTIRRRQSSVVAY
eukprot:7703480-Pyramimonas_sp.AAC.1